MRILGWGLGASLMLGACGQMVTPDRNYLYQHARHGYRASSGHCYRAAKEVLRDYGAKLVRAERRRGVLATARFRHDKVVRAEATYSSATARAYVVDHQFSLQVSGDRETCFVRFDTYKAWVNNRRKRQLNSRYLHNKVVEPFFEDFKAALVERVQAQSAK